ncbi:MAG: hypothetical protein LLF90_12340 [Methanomicrobiaceae archaeon]|jgi:hypothetical protein|uniref:hypothetical protein n=1 Tax=Methanoculleus sp. TaxID=90427 RepID=UPI00321085B5|nr:hypothetical protein [Methanomicrobiaceae archaeon]
MQRRDRIDGSPRDETCANIDSHGTADNSSPSRAIRAATGERRAGVVPLYLIPQAVADEIRRHGRAVREIHIHRTRNHHYTVSVERGRP